MNMNNIDHNDHEKFLDIHNYPPIFHTYHHEKSIYSVLQEDQYQKNRDSRQNGGLEYMTKWGAELTIQKFET